MKLLFSLIFLLIAVSGIGQRYVLEKSEIVFFSEASIENIEATNTKSVSIFNPTTGEIAFSIPIKGFEFEKALMKEHFNEKYLESDLYPKATFQGNLLKFNPDNLSEQKVIATGRLSIHGVVNEVSIPGTVHIKSNRIVAQSTFKIRLKEYGIEIPKLFWSNIAEEVDVTVEFLYKPL